MSDEMGHKTRQELIAEVLSQPVLARLATTNAKTLQPHLVIVWFIWDGTNAWVSSFSSTRKVKDLQSNPRAALLIEPKGEGHQLQAVLLEGEVQVVAEPHDFVTSQSLKIYAHYLGDEGAQAADPQSWAIDPENRLIKLTPDKVIAW